MTSEILHARSYRALRLFIVALLASSCLGVAVESTFAQAEVAELSDDEKAACDSIVEHDVVANLTFLASDELEGRGTGTKGLEIASAYVASRFRAAGFQGPDSEKPDNFFQTHQIDMLVTPSQGIKLTDQQDNAIKALGLLSNGTEVISHSGSFASFDPANDDDKEKKFEGPVVLDATSVLEGRGSANGQIAARLLANAARKVAKQGATAIIVPVSVDSPVAKFAVTQMDAPRMASSRGGSGIPILLVEEGLKAESLKHMTLPAVSKVKQPVANVVGILPGSDPDLKDEAIIISAHLDHLGQRDNGTDDGIYNGADDNASGVCGVLALAKAYSMLKTAPKRTTIFVAFWGEERGLLGSRYMVENPIWPLDKTVANVNLEMIGRPEAGANGKIWMTGWDQSDLGKLMNVGSQRLEIEIFEHPSFSNRLYRSSDNWAFVAGGVVAHSFSAGSLHDDYHQPGDEWQKLNTRHMAIVCKGLFTGSLPLAQGQVTPKGVEKE